MQLRTVGSIQVETSVMSLERVGFSVASSGVGSLGLVIYRVSLFHVHVHVIVGDGNTLPG
jgi:hypothetical protein